MAIFDPNLETIAKFNPKPTPGEQALLNFLAATLDDTYEVFFQPHINGDHPDIVVMRKGSGILIIEVKDWSLDSYKILARDVWELKNVTYQEGKQRVRSPIVQVETYKKNFYNLHIDELVEKNVLNKHYFSMISTAVYLHCADDRQIYNFFTRNDDYREKYCIIFGNNSLTKDGFKRILSESYLNRPSKLFTDDLYEKFHRVLQPIEHTREQGMIIHYTAEQRKIINSKAGSRQKVRGVAGGGKTQALAQRAVNAAERTGERVLILTFNITLRNYIHDKISLVRNKTSWRKFTILHYHAFIKSYCNNNALCLEEDFDKNDEQLMPAYPEKYQTIIVDEIQDYKKTWVQNIHNMLAENGEILFCGDEKQNIYKRELDVIDKRPYTKLSGNWTTLKMSFRISNEIAALADKFQQNFLTRKYEYDKLIGQTEISFASNISYYYLEYFNELKIVDIYHDMLEGNRIHDNEACFLASRVELLRPVDKEIRRRLHKKTQTMFETQEQYEQIIALHTDRKWVVDENAIELDIEAIRRSKKFNFWMNSGKTKLSTIHSFKGWEIPTLILLIDNGQLDFAYVESKKEFATDELIYTAITRCKQNLIIININNERYHEFFQKPGILTNSS